MRVHVKLQLTFEEKAPGSRSSFELELAPGTSVAQALETLCIAPAVPKVIIVSGRVRSPEHKLMPGDELTVFPSLEGG